MRILLAVHRYWPHIGGAESVVERLAEHLANRGHSVCVATGAHRSRPQVCSRNGVEIRSFALGPGWNHRSAAASEYRTFFADGRWDVRFIYAAQSWQLDVVADMVGRDGVRDVLAPCGYSRLHDPLMRPYFEALPAVLRNCAAVVYHSSLYQDFRFAEERSVAGNAVIIPNAADPAEFPNPTRSAHDIEIITVANHYRLKGHRYVFRLARDLGVRATIVGQPPSRYPWMGCALSCRLHSALDTRVDVVAPSTRAAALDLLARAHVVVLPSSVECSPLLIFEAMAAAKPWVAFDVGNVRELPGGVVAASYVEMLQSVRELLADRAMADAVGGAGRAAIESRYNWHSVLHQYEQVLAI